MLFPATEASSSGNNKDGNNKGVYYYFETKNSQSNDKNITLQNKLDFFDPHIPWESKRDL